MTYQMSSVAVLALRLWFDKLTIRSGLEAQLNIEICASRMCGDEFFAGGDVVAHQHTENVVGVGGVGYFYFFQNSYIDYKIHI